MAAESDRSIANVLGDIVGNVQQIIRSEVRLAKVEVGEEIARAGRGGVTAAAGAVLCMMALGFVLLAAVYALALVWPAWAAALTVGVGAGVIGGVCIRAGLSRLKQVHLAPPKTVATLQENIQWAKTRAR
ncbi:MAG TPA: phage holin family protein [Vicinamibacterales bacterium]|nr:phage holin family protein [Vicinamibacterales bacterium]